MKIVCYGNGVVKVEDSVCQSVKEGYSVVSVKACGLCGSDMPRMFSDKAYHYPLVVGHEFSGKVEYSSDKSLVGAHVAVFPILPCKKCEFCKERKWAQCTAYDYYGSRRDGGMQDRILIKNENLIVLPPEVSFEAGAMIEPSAVCLHAMKKADIKAGETVVIYGAGTIGALCGLWAKSFGAKVYFSDISEQRLSFIEGLGLHRLKEEKGDVVVEASGASSAFNSAILAAKSSGRVLLIGNASGDMTISSETYGKILRKQLTIFGNWNSDFNDEADDWRDSIKAIAEKRFDPTPLITHRYTFSDGEKMAEMIKGGKEFFNKVMVVSE